jgi:AraC-like DNA-binding protein
MRSRGLGVKSEFVTPWGICDLVGVSFNDAHVRHRLRHGQTRAIGSIARAALLLQIPDAETGRSISMPQLARRCAASFGEHRLREEAAQLVTAGFVVRSATGCLQKLNGWMPLQHRLVAVELKLSRVEDAVRQATNNCGFASESYVALPFDTARRVLERKRQRSRVLHAGVGLLGVRIDSCEELIPAKANVNDADPAIQLYCVEKFWRSRSKAAEHERLHHDLRSS